MKILHTVESYDPEAHGMQQVVKQISERLAKAGHEVTVGTSYNSKRNSRKINGVNIEEFKISGKSVKGIKGNLSEIKRYQNYLINSEFDIITNFAAQQWATDLMLPIINKIRAIKVFVPTGFSELNNKSYADYFTLLKDTMKKYTVNIFLSEDYRDINYAKQNGIENYVIIPNGASQEEFTNEKKIDIYKYLNISRNSQIILHVGSHTGLKGHNETISIFRKARIPNSTLLIIGNNPRIDSRQIFITALKMIANRFTVVTNKRFYPSCALYCKLQAKIFKYYYSSLKYNKRIIIKELSRDYIISAYLHSKLFLFPSNIECSPIVLFECLASGTPFLTSNVGNANEIILWTNSGILLPTEIDNSGVSRVDITKSAKLLEQTSKNHYLLDEMRKNGLKSFQEKYTWEKISKRYEDLYISLLRNK